MKFRISVPRGENEGFCEIVQLPDMEAAEEFAERKMDEYDDAMVNASEVSTVSDIVETTYKAGGEECPLCGDQIEEDDKIVAPKPKTGSDKSREELVGHRKCWRKEGYRSMRPNYHPVYAREQTRKWLNDIEIQSLQEVEG